MRIVGCEVSWALMIVLSSLRHAITLPHLKKFPLIHRDNN
ncbi:MAG: hypothetical protein BWZ00_00737 [Bacteroidetes bacterium ADurb.BinA174]|jgi:hypothetical protein|nr:MAG: hypothetical protein BWZ00_00737 [Bacteroidetes bacterium ADurb.BinA174]